MTEVAAEPSLDGHLSNGHAETRVTAEKRDLLVLYGSQTGSAQDVAERIGRQGRRRHFRTKVFAMDEFDIVGSIVIRRRSNFIVPPFLSMSRCIHMCYDRSRR